MLITRLLLVLVLILIYGKKEQINYIVNLYLKVLDCFLIHCFLAQNMFALFVIYYLLKVAYKPI